MTFDPEPLAGSVPQAILDWLRRVADGDASAGLGELQELARSPEGSVEASVEIVMELIERVRGDGWFLAVAEGPLMMADRAKSGAVVERLGYFAPGEDRVARLIALVPSEDGLGSRDSIGDVPPSLAERLSPELREHASADPEWLESWREFEEGLDDQPPLA